MRTFTIEIVYPDGIQCFDVQGEPIVNPWGIVMFAHRVVGGSKWRVSCAKTGAAFPRTDSATKRGAIRLVMNLINKHGGRKGYLRAVRRSRKMLTVTGTEATR